MFYIFLLFVVGVILFGRRSSFPSFVLGVSWLISSLPIYLGLISYNYFDFSSLQYPLILIAYISCFVFGGVFYDLSRRSRMNGIRSLRKGAQLDVSLPVDAAQIHQVSNGVWLISLVAMICHVIDFKMLGGASLDDLPELRDLFQSKISTPFTLIANVTTWSCLYCFAYALFFKRQLNRLQFARFVLPTAGYFLVAVLSAGRQSAFQLMLFAIIIQSCVPRAGTAETAGWVRRNLGIVVFASLMMAYMGYVAVNRNDGAISTDKAEVLAHIFDFQVGPALVNAKDYVGSALVEAAVEAMVYFSASVALFSIFLDLNGIGDFYSGGVMTFPFLMRQLEPITGMSVLGALQSKISLIYSSGAMGSGWTTGISSYILDFGYLGAAIFMAIQGFYSQYEWRRYRRTRHFVDVLCMSLVAVGAIYTPFLLASAETNLFLLWMFCLLLRLTPLYRTQRVVRKPSFI